MDESKSKLVSVIMPVYNGEKYLREAIESVREQTYTNWELLLVENRSTDQSPEICLLAAGQDQRIRILAERQKGISYARNCGMHEAKGTYIMFLDADDYLSDRTVMEKMVEEMEKTNRDILVCNYARLWNGRILPAMDCCDLKKFSRETEEFRFRGFFSEGMLSYVWGKLYRREFLEKQKIQFNEYVYAEDKMFSMQCYVKQARYGFLKDIGYIYRKNEDSISFMYKPDSIRCWLKIAHDLQLLLERQKMNRYEDMVNDILFFAAFFDAKMEYMKHGRSLKAVRWILKRYGEDPLAAQSFRQLAFDKNAKRPKQKLWRFMMRGFATAMQLHFYLLLAIGIKLLIDWRIDERLSDTGLRE